MRNPSKRTAQIALVEQRRLAAANALDVEGFAAAVAEIKALEAQPDLYTCVECGDEFPDGPHVDLLIAAILVFGEDGAVTDAVDYGIHESSQGKAGRRFKVCKKCIDKWVHPPLEYAELR